MRKQTALAAIATLACTAALAQTPAIIDARPSAEVNPATSGGLAADNAQNKVDNRRVRSMEAPANPAAGDGLSAPVAEVDPTTAGGRAAATAEESVNTRLMDGNGDGLVSRQELHAYHANARNSIVPSTNTGVSTADLDKLNHQVMVTN